MSCIDLTTWQGTMTGLSGIIIAPVRLASVPLDEINWNGVFQKKVCEWKQLFLVPAIKMCCLFISLSHRIQQGSSEYLMMRVEVFNKGSVPYWGSNDNNSTRVSLSEFSVHLC